MLLNYGYCGQVPVTPGELDQARRELAYEQNPALAGLVGYHGLRFRREAPMDGYDGDAVSEAEWGGAEQQLADEPFLEKKRAAQSSARLCGVVGCENPTDGSGVFCSECWKTIGPYYDDQRSAAGPVGAGSAAAEREK